MLQPEIRIDTMVHVLARDGIKIWHSLVEPIQGGHTVGTQGLGANSFKNAVLRDVQTVDDWFTLVPFVAFFPRTNFMILIQWAHRKGRIVTLVA